MPEENEPTTPPAEEPTTPPEGESTTGGEGTPTEEELSPEQLRALVTSANAEAANYRVKLRETEQKLSAAKTPEEVETATSELRSTVASLEHQILVRDVASEHKLPADLADALKGSTKEELEAHAKVLAKYVPTDEEPPPGNLGGGLHPTGGADPLAGLNPRELAAMARKRRGA